MQPDHWDVSPTHTCKRTRGRTRSKGRTGHGDVLLVPCHGGWPWCSAGGTGSSRAGRGRVDEARRVLCARWAHDVSCAHRSAMATGPPASVLSGAGTHRFAFGCLGLPQRVGDDRLAVAVAVAQIFFAVSVLPAHELRARDAPPGAKARSGRRRDILCICSPCRTNRLPCVDGVMVCVVLANASWCRPAPAPPRPVPSHPVPSPPRPAQSIGQCSLPWTPPFHRHLGRFTYRAPWPPAERTATPRGCCSG